MDFTKRGVLHSMLLHILPVLVVSLLHGSNAPTLSRVGIPKAVALASDDQTAPSGKLKLSAIKRQAKLPQIAVIGRPNVGKSTIANRLTKRFAAGSIVFNEPGVTRDRTYGEGFWNGHEFTVVDTGGLVFDDKEDEVFLREIRQQAMIALDGAVSVLFVVDGQSGRTVLDEQIASFLRRQKVPVVLAVNKCESTVDGEVQAADFWSLGMGTPWAVSGLHGTGMGDVMDELVKPLPPFDSAALGEADETPELRVAILGRPNVGKSSLLNRLTNTERAIVCDLSGTTRDAIDQPVVNHGTTFVFVDTAGVRRVAKVSKGVEEEMVRRALKAGRRSDVCLLVVDATEGVSEQVRGEQCFLHAPSSPPQHSRPYAHAHGHALAHVHAPITCAYAHAHAPIYMYMHVPRTPPIHACPCPCPCPYARNPLAMPCTGPPALARAVQQQPAI